jgi:hypothetical protein
MFRIKTVYSMPSRVEQSGVYLSSPLQIEEVYDYMEGRFASHRKRGWELDRHHVRRMTKGNETVEFSIVLEN